MRPLNRPVPALPVGGMQTYGIVSPLETHFRPASCAEVDCEPYRHGWRIRLEGLTPQDVHAATHSGRRWRRVEVGPAETYLEYEAGQACFRAATHRKSLERPELYVVRGGDWRASTGVIRRHTSAGSWVDDFATHQEQVAKRVNG